jgi:inorganic pyrophosphatase
MDNDKSNVDVIIEISKGGHIKYEYDKNAGIMVCDRVLHTPMKYPFNYGFVPQTLSDDGDPLDVVVLMDDSLIPGCLIRCRIVGYLETQDDKGDDPKLIVCPLPQIDPSMETISDIDQELANTYLLKRVKYFFEHYKDLENKSVVVGNYCNRVEGIRISEEAKQRYHHR